MKKIWIMILGVLLIIAGMLLILRYPQFVPVLGGLFLSSFGLTLFLSQLRGRIIRPAPEYRYRAQELGNIFRGPPR